MTEYYKSGSQAEFFNQKINQMLRVQLSAALVMAAAFAIDLSQTKQTEIDPI